MKIRNGIYLLFVFVVISCKKKNNANEQALEVCKINAVDGDIIFRLEEDFTSYLVAQLSPDAPDFGHCGIVKREGNKTYVYNILPEGPENGEVQKTVRKTLIDTFLDPQKTVKFALYRYLISAIEKDKLIKNVELMQQSKVIYDARFDYKTDTAIYCSELISKALELATFNEKKIKQVYIDKTKIIGVRNYFKFMNDTVDLSKYPVVTIDQLYLNSFTQKVYEYQYDPKLRNRRSLHKW